MNKVNHNQSVVNFQLMDGFAMLMNTVMPDATENEMVDQFINAASIIASRFIQQLPSGDKAAMHSKIVRALDGNIKFHSRMTKTPEESIIFTGYSLLHEVPDAVLFAEIAKHFEKEELEAGAAPIYSSYFEDQALYASLSSVGNTVHVVNAANKAPYIKALRVLVAFCKIGRIRAFAGEILERYEAGKIWQGGDV